MQEQILFNRDNEARSSILQLFKRKPVFSLPEEDLKATSQAYEFIKFSELSNSILALTGFTCGAICADIEYSKDLDNGIAYNLVSIVGSISTAMLLVSIVWRKLCILQWEKGRALYSSYDTLKSSGKLKSLGFELVINALHPICLLKNYKFRSYNTAFHIYLNYYYNDIFAILTLVRTYHLVRLYSVFSKYRTERAYRICKNNGKFSGTSWAVKCLVNDDPIKVTAAMMVSGILIGGFCFRIFERPLYVESGYDFSDYANSMWLVIVTMTTVGYGDFFPNSLPGRIVGLVICIWGVLVISMMVIMVSNSLKLGKDEEKALLLYKRLDLREQIVNAAGKMLFYALRYKKAVRTHPNATIYKSAIFSKFQQSIREFRQLKMRKKILYKFNSAEDNIERRISTITNLSKRYADSLDSIQLGLKGLIQSEA